MNRRPLILAAPLSVLLAACGQPTEPPAPVPAADPALPLEQRVRGFVTGAMARRDAVHVFIDMQCPHCATLWEASKPLWAQTRFVWVPVVVLGRVSLAQGATILGVDDPAQTMDTHKESLLARRGGMSAVDAHVQRYSAVVQANTQVMQGLGVRSVPHLVGRHAGTGAEVSHTGALPTQRLREVLGLAT
jgi:thiol:disulfide interchange protein DsbG